MRKSANFNRSAAIVAACAFLLIPLPALAGSTTEWTVSGTVIDAVNGHPLSATIEIPGTTIDPIDVGPDGQYSIDLPEDEVFELMTTAVADGYEVALTTVGPLTEDVSVIIQLAPDLAACQAPGYFKDFTTYYSETFETDDGGYTTDAPGFVLPWEWGTPTAWPDECRVGSTCWGTDLDGDFQTSGHEHLTSISIDLAAATDVDGLTLYWDQAWDLGFANAPDATVETRIDGVTELVWENVGVPHSSFWLRLDADVLAAAGETLMVRWTLDASGTTNTAPGLFVDNVRVIGYECKFDQVPPTLHLEPTEIEVQMFPDETTSQTLVLNNLGDQNLEWSVGFTAGAGLQSTSINDFTGYYDPANWTLINDPPATGGFVDDNPGPPVELFVMGGDEGVVGYTEFQIPIPRSGEVSFDWGFETPVFEFTDAGYMLNDSYTSLADTFNQVDHFEESITIPVEAGDRLGFRVQVWQGYSGPAEFGITSFDAPTCDPPDDVEWLDAPSTSGTTDSHDSDNLVIEFDSDGLLPDVYETTLCMLSNDPLNPVILVPVTLTVQAPAHFGTITGQIDSLGYCSDDRQPGAAADVEVAGSNQTWNINADENGEYFIQIDSAESPIDVTASFPDHLDGVESELMLGAGATEIVDFDLLLDAPCAETDPESLTFTVAENGTATETLAIQNINGAIPLNWSIFLHEPASASSAEIAPAGSSFAVPAFATTNDPNQGYVSLDVLDPGTFTIVNDETGFTSLLASAFVNNDFSEQLFLRSGVHTLFSFDTQTGNYTEVGDVTGAETSSTSHWLSMSYDHVTDTLYSVRWDNEESVLFTIDPVALEATEIGTVEGPGLPADVIIVSIATDFHGQMYGIALDQELLVKIDKYTGEATTVGSLGVDVDRTVQDMDFDHSENILYWARVPDTGSQTEMMRIDTDTGAATYIGDIDSGSRLLSMSIAMPSPCASVDTVDWLDVLTTSGTINSGEQESVQISIDADGLAQGDYQAQICVETDDSRRLIIVVPIELEVAAIDPPDISIIPTSLSISLADNETDTQVFSIGNQGEQRLDWSVDENTTGCALPGWADVTPISGSINENDNMAVFVDFDADGLAPDTYHGKVCIQSNDPATPLTEVDLQLTVVERALSLDKSLISAPDPIVAGSTLEYRIEATNTGDVDLENVMVSDNLINPSSHSCSNLPVSQTCMLEGTYTVTSDDMDAGVIINTATTEADGVTEITVDHHEIVDENIFADRFEEL